MNIGGNDGAAAGDFTAHEFGFDFFALGDEEHFFGDDAFAGQVHLRQICRKCTWPAKASSPKKCSSSPSAKKSSPNSYTTKTPAPSPSSPPTFNTAISSRCASAS